MVSHKITTFTGNTQTEIQYLEKALEIYNTVLGEPTKEVAYVLNSLAEAHNKLGT